MQETERGVHAERFEQILKDTQPRIRAYIAGMGVNVDSVDDVAQEVYLALHQELHRVPESAAPLQWLKGVARNLCMNYFRKEKRRADRHAAAIGELLSRQETPLESLVAEASGKDGLRLCVERLQDRQRRLLQLRYEQNLACEVIARLTSTSAEAIRIALYRVRLALRDCLVQRLGRGLA